MRKTGFLAAVFPMIIHRCSVALAFTILHSLFTIHSLYAAGASAGEFLKIVPGVRAAAMAGAFTALADDKTAVYYNPAGLSQLRWREASISYNKWILDTSLTSLTYGHTFGVNGSAAVGFTYYDSGDIEKRGDTKDAAGSFRHTGLAARVAYGNEFFEGVSLGMAIKYAAETLDGYSTGAVGGDAGVHYRTIFDFGETSFGAAAQNIGSKMWEQYDMPLLVRAGVALKPSKDFLTLAVEYVAPQAGIPYMGAGMEITPGDLSLRAGYRAGVSDVSGLSAVTLGFGYRYTQDYDYLFNYAFSTQGDLGLTHRVEVAIAF